MEGLLTTGPTPSSFILFHHSLYLPGVVEVVAGLWGSEASQTAVAAAGPDTLALQQDTAGLLQY